MHSVRRSYTYINHHVGELSAVSTIHSLMQVIMGASKSSIKRTLLNIALYFKGKEVDRCAV